MGNRLREGNHVRLGKEDTQPIWYNNGNVIQSTLPDQKNSLKKDVSSIARELCEHLVEL